MIMMLSVMIVMIIMFVAVEKFLRAINKASVLYFVVSGMFSM